MHTAIDATLRQRGLELLREQALGADLAQRLVDVFVSRRLERHELGLHAVRGEHRGHLSRLSQGELGRAGGYAEQAWLCDRVSSHCCSIYSARFQRAKIGKGARTKGRQLTMIWYYSTVTCGRAGRLPLSRLE